VPPGELGHLVHVDEPVVAPDVVADSFEVAAGEVEPW